MAKKKSAAKAKPVVMKIVSANYRNRNSEMRWLVRDEGAPLDSAVEYKGLKAKGVVFYKSTTEERGFGCSIVARCKSVEVIGDRMQKKGRRQVTLRFVHDHFYAFEIAEKVGKCTTLNLNPDGSIYATLGE